MTLKKLLLLVNLDNWIDFVAVVVVMDQKISLLLLMSLVMVAESLMAVLLFVWMEMIKPWFVVIIFAALIVEMPPVIVPVCMSQMVDKMIEVALEYVKMSPLTAVAVDASFSMFAKTATKSVSLIADAGTRVFVLQLLNAAELPGTNVPMMIVWQPVGIPMFGELLFVFVLMNPSTAPASPVWSLWNAVEIIVMNIPQMFVEIPFEMLILVAY